MVVPPKHRKMIILSRKTNGCWVPPFLGNPHIFYSHVSYTKKRWVPAENPLEKTPVDSMGTVTPKGRFHSNKVLPTKNVLNTIQVQDLFHTNCLGRCFFPKKNPQLHFFNVRLFFSDAEWTPGCPGFTFSPASAPRFRGKDQEEETGPELFWSFFVDFAQEINPTKNFEKKKCVHLEVGLFLILKL